MKRDLQKLLGEIADDEEKLASLAKHSDKDVPAPGSILHPKVVKLKGCRCATCNSNLAFKL